MKKIIFSILTISCITFAWASFHNGETIYKNSCQTCHNPATAPLMKASPAHDVDAWKARMQKAEAIAKANPKKYKNALEVLVASVKNGKGAMPAGGMCKNPKAKDKKCSDKDYADAIKFMSSEKK